MSTQASTTLTREQLGFVHRSARWVAVLCAMACMALPAMARVRHNDAWARAQFAKAERTREALNGRPAGERTRREYQRAIDAYRRVYFGSPASSKADPSVVATAELMVEMGRRFDDNKILRGAVEEYRFLRKEYPGSKYRFEALFTIGEIYKDDLKDADEARKTFEDFAHRYPRNRLADDARAAVKEIDEAAAEAKRNPPKGQKKKGKEIASERPNKTAGERAKADKDAASGAPASGNSPGASSGNESAAETASTPTNSDSAVDAPKRGELPRVTGVRHWSTPDYTRVAIDVERDVKFDSQRIANPDRIFFDLKDTKLASTLVGKSFDVDDGFLKKIRVAEFQPGKTRVVLEVDELSSYDAFLLPNPYRLIIDIHGKQSRASLLAKAHSGSAEAEDTSSTSPGEDAEEEASDLTVEHKGQKKSEKEHAIVAKVNPRSANDNTASVDAKPAKITRGERDGNSADNAAGQGSSVVKTTVAVKGSNKKIPKTIVDADDGNTSAESKTQARKRRQSATGASHQAWARKDASDNSMSGDGDDSSVEEAKAVPPDTREDVREDARGRARINSNGARGKSSTASSRKKKTHSSSDADDLAELEMREARPTASGDRSLTRALGLKIGKIVIDAGHGGHDTGTIGPNGLLEKDLVLDVARRLGRLLEARLGAEVVYTRRDDTFVPLETRTAIANREQADLFISVHANSSRDPDARGVETYYLNFTSSPEALEVAARENAVSEKSIHELQDLVKKIALKEKIDESREFASNVQDSLYGGLALRNAGVRNRGVKKAPFIVLIGANMPSILAEISFVSNPTDERKLEGSEQRQRIAESLYHGVAKYAGGLSGVKVASKIEKPSGQ